MLVHQLQWRTIHTHTHTLARCCAYRKQVCLFASICWMSPKWFRFRNQTTITGDRLDLTSYQPHTRQRQRQQQQQHHQRLSVLSKICTVCCTHTHIHTFFNCHLFLLPLFAGRQRRCRRRRRRSRGQWPLDKHSGGTAHPHTHTQWSWQLWSASYSLISLLSLSTVVTDVIVEHKVRCRRTQWVSAAQTRVKNSHTHILFYLWGEGKQSIIVSVSDNCPLSCFRRIRQLIIASVTWRQRTVWQIITHFLGRSKFKPK